jgi:hypothetical protein
MSKKTNTSGQIKQAPKPGGPKTARKGEMTSKTKVKAAPGTKKTTGTTNDKNTGILKGAQA